MKFDVIIQCRLQSSRLPAKIFLTLDKKFNSLDILINNLKKIRIINNIILATPNDKTKSIFKLYAQNKKISFFSPKVDTKNVLGRFYFTAKRFNSENIIRITSDCPFVNINIVKDMINIYKEKKMSFLTNNKPRFIPHGFDCEIFSRKVLNLIYKKSNLSNEKEHVTLWFYKKKFKINNQYQVYKKNYSKIRLTIDYLDDYIFIKKNFKILYKLASAKRHEKILRRMIEKKNN